MSFFRDDIEGTVAELKKRGATFKQDPIDQGYGWVTYFEIPGGIEVQLYEPKYQKPASKPARKNAPKRAAKKKPAAKKKAASKAAASKAKPKAKRAARKRR